jgi:YQGE family putative transporter
LILGFRDGAFGYIVSILIFIAFKNELNMGKFTTLTSLLAILSSYIIGRYYRKSLANQLFFIGSVMCFVSTVVLVMWTNYTGVFINGVLTAIFTCFWNIPLGTLVYDIAGKRASKSNNMGDYMIVREIPTAVGRIASIILYITVSRSFMDAAAIKIILPFLSFMIIINFIYLRKNNM